MIALLAVASCSFVAAKHPDGGSEACMPGRAAPIVDAVVVATAAVADTLAATCNDPSRDASKGPNACTGADVAAVSTTAFAIPMLVGAIYGFTTASCRATAEPTRATASR
jgi:hypothetical protein